MNRERLIHPGAEGKRVDMAWTRPEGEGPFPALLFVHGHQFGERIGWVEFEENGCLARMTGRGFVAAAVSQPGYGASDGPPDFCGPLSQDAVICALDHLRALAFVRPDKVGLYGFSRGAIVSGMVAARAPWLAAVTLSAGIYDLEEALPRIGVPDLLESIEAEAGHSPEAFRARSALLHAGKIASPLLLMHGGRDDRSGPAQAERLGREAAARGIPVRLKIFEEADHFLSLAAQYGEMDPFFERHLR